MKYKWIIDPNNRGIYNNGDLELKCPFCGYEWEYDEDTTHKEFSECPKCLSDMTLNSQQSEKKVDKFLMN